MLILATEKLTMHMLVEETRKTETFQYISYIISVSVEVLSNELHLRIQKTFQKSKPTKNRYERCDQL